MGGNALPCKTERVSSEKYHEIAQKIIKTLTSSPTPVIPKSHIQALSFYTDKTTHGDIDIVINAPMTIIPALLTQLHRHTKLEPDTVINNNILHVAVYEVQVDFMFVSGEQAFTNAVDYYSWNCLGALLGVVAKQCHFKLNQEGLMYRVNGTHGHFDVPVTPFYRSALYLLGYDVDRFLQGFTSLESIYEFVASSPFFESSAAYKELNRNAKKGKRRGRAIFDGFAEYLDENPASAYMTPEALLGRCKLEYPDFEKTLKEAVLRDALIRKASKLLNGKVITEWTGLEGKALGAFIIAMKRHVKEMGCDWHEYIVQCDDIKQTVLHHYHNHKPIEGAT